MRSFSLLLFASVLLPAQFTSLSTDFSGSTLFFTADFTQAETGQPAYGKLFIADDAGIRPFLIRPREETPVYVFTLGFITNYYDLLGVDIASNGSRIAVTAYHECTVSSLWCSFMDRSDVYDDQGQYMFSADGYVLFSPNGAWALAVGVSTSPPTVLTLIEVSTGARYGLPLSLGNRHWRLHKVADNGTVASVSLNGLLLFRPHAGAQRIPTDSRTIDWAAIDSQGATVVWQERDSAGSYLRVSKVEAPLPSTSLRSPGRIDCAPRISDDGASILFLSRPVADDDPQIFSTRPDGAERRQVTVIPEGVTAAILAGNGSVAWAVTRTGRLLKIDVPSGTQQQFIGPVATFYSPAHCDGGSGGSRWGGAPGEVVSVSASVMPGESVEIRIGGEQAEVTEAGVQRVSFQVPTTLQPGTRHELSIRKSGDSRWIAKPITFNISGLPGGSSTICGPNDAGVLR